MKIDSKSIDAMARTAEVLRFQNHQQDIKALQDHLNQEKQRLKRLAPIDPNKGSNVDTLA